jgi:hypothetical protein
MGALTAESEETVRARGPRASLTERLATPVEDLAWLCVIVGGLVLAAALVWLAPPLSDLYPSPINDVFPVWKVVIDPEPVEDVRSMLALATPVLLAAIVLTFGSRHAPHRGLDSLVIGGQVAGLGLLVWAVLEQPRSGPLLAPDYFFRFVLSGSNLAAGVVIGLGLTAAVLRPPRWSPPNAAVGAWGYLRSSTWIPLAIALAVTTVWLLPAVFTDSTLSQSGSFAAGHVPVQGEDYFSVVNGRTPLVNYIAQYTNLLPLALAPVLNLFGPSITSYSIAMCVLSGLGMLAICGAFVAITRRTWTGLALYVPWVALSLFPWHEFGSHREFNGIYYAVFPGRYFGPFVLTWLCAQALRGRRIPIWGLFGLAGLVVLNNYEFGIGALFALIAALGLGWDRSLPLRRRVGDLLVQGAVGLLAAITLVSAVTLTRAGELPDLSLLTYFNRLFLRDSYGLEPMSTLGLHWALYATYTAALLISAVRYVRREADRTLTGMLAFSGIFGLTTGMYFVGRSSVFQLMLLFPAWGFSLALVAWTAAGSLAAARRDGLRLRRLLLPACAALIGLGVMISAIARVPPPHRQIDRLDTPGPRFDVSAPARFVASRAHPGEHVLMIGTGPDHLVAEHAGVVNVSPLNGVTSLVSPAEANRSLDQLEDEGGNEVFEAVSALHPGPFVFGVPEFAEILRARGYRLVGEDPGLALRFWRRR